MEIVIKRDLLKIILPLLIIAGCTKATVEHFQYENGIMYVEYNGNPNTQRPFTGEIVENHDEKDGELIFKRCFDIEGNECECSDLGR
jgi:hypothetical protein